MSDTDSTFNFLISMIYSQLFNLLCEKADDVYGGRSPSMCAASSTSAPISADTEPGKAHGHHPQPRDLRLSGAASPKSAKALYKDNADTIIGNCDSSIFLGGKEPVR